MGRRRGIKQMVMAVRQPDLYMKITRRRGKSSASNKKITTFTGLNE